MPGRNATLSLNQRVIDIANQLRRLRIPPKHHTYTRTGAISAAASGGVPLHNDSGLVLGIRSVRVTLGVAPSAQPVMVDVTFDGTSIFAGALPQADVGATIGDPVIPDSGQWMPGVPLYVDVTQGDDTATDLHVTIVIA